LGNTFASALPFDKSHFGLETPFAVLAMRHFGELLFGLLTALEGRLEAVWSVWTAPGTHEPSREPRLGGSTLGWVDAVVGDLVPDESLLADAAFIASVFPGFVGAGIRDVARWHADSAETPGVLLFGEARERDVERSSPVSKLDFGPSTSERHGRKVSFQEARIETDVVDTSCIHLGSVLILRDASVVHESACFVDDSTLLPRIGQPCRVGAGIEFHSTYYLSFLPLQVVEIGSAALRSWLSVGI
jgi:hypothetical protein